MKIIVRLLACVLLVTAVGGCSSRGGKGSKNRNFRTVEIEATGYCKCGSCCGWKRNWLGRPVYAYGKNKGEKKEVGITASGTKAKVGTIAADISVYPYGTRMNVPGYGWGTVEDIGGAIKGERIDLFFDSHQEALEWGRQTIKVEVVMSDGQSGGSSEYGDKRRKKPRFPDLPDLPKPGDFPFPVPFAD